ncbi:MAG: M48 family metallopeptidase [Candidatus Omnitrophica bacterium]|nr:M48 family metallopeptidase [Candidatus Omnitrophota bacterium]
MRNNSCASASIWLLCTALSGCATPQYAIRPTPTPDESEWVVDLERTISAYQAQELERQGSRLIHAGERLWGFDVASVLRRLSRVTERPSLPYRVFLLQDRDPNAVALADGRVYVTSGMLNYLSSRGSREDELAAIVSHELAHTVAQHLIRRYRQLQQQQLLMAVVGVGTAIASQQGGSSIGSLANDAASLVTSVANSAYSQDQELEADQLGARYMARAGYDPYSAVAVLRDFRRFAPGGIFLSTHPDPERRAQDLERFLTETTPASSTPASVEPQRQRLKAAQRLYPAGSLSWQNLQRQLDDLDALD